MTPQARAVYIEVANVYNGKNNGFLARSVRQLSALEASSQQTPLAAWAPCLALIGVCWAGPHVASLSRPRIGRPSIAFEGRRASWKPTMG